MLKVGLTGNIGSGKSLVAQIFFHLGAAIYHADEESKKILQTEPVVAEVTRCFGFQILTPQKQIDKKKLALVVFSDASALQCLNSILHPRVREDFWHWTTKYRHLPYVVQEAAIIFESGFQTEFDRIIHVSCPEDIAIQRVMSRDGTDRQTVLQRMQFQMKDSEKASLSDYIIQNDGSRFLIPQALSIHEKLVGPGVNKVQ